MAPATLPSGDTPGWKIANVEASRPMFGRLISEVPVSVVPTVALVVCNSAPTTEVTSTVVVVDPTSSRALMVSTWPTFTAWLVAWYTEKPALLNEML